MNIFVRNLDVSVTDINLIALFTPFGVVRSAMRIGEGTVSRSADMCWVVMDEDVDAENAIKSLNDSIHMQKVIAVTKGTIAA